MEYRTIIYNAARDGNLRRLKVFLTEDKDKKEVDTLLSAKTFGTPALVIAARNGHCDVVKYLVIEKEADVSVVGSVSFDGETIEGAPALWASAAAGHFEIVKLLVENKADVNQRTATNSTPLRGACFDGHTDIVRYLVEHGAEIEIANRHGHTCLMIAAYRRQPDVVRYLLDAGADVNRSSLKGNTALHDAAEAGSLDILQMLLKAGAVMQKDSFGQTPMLSAASLGHCAVLEYLVERPQCRWNERVEGLQLLGATCVDKRRDLGAAVQYWRRALALLEARDTEPVRFSPSEDQQEEAEETEPTPEGPGRISAYENQAEAQTVEDLEKVVGDPDALRMQALLIRERILGPAHADTIYYLRYRGAIYADVGRFDRCIQLWMHALRMQQRELEPMCALTQGTIVSFVELFAYMLNDYAQRPTDASGLPLTFEDIFQVLEIAKEEIRRGMKGGSCPELNLSIHPHEKEDDEALKRLCSITLHLVCLVCRVEKRLSAENAFQIRKLLYDLIRLGPTDSKGGSLLHLACDPEISRVGRVATCRFPNLTVCEILLEVGADPNATDKDGRTPLHVILANRVARPSIVRCLLGKGAHIDQRCNAGERAIDSLRKPGFDIHPMDYSSLKCLAAAKIKDTGIPFRKEIPKQLGNFVEMH